MLSGRPLAEVFNDIDTSELCFSPNDQQWMPDLFEDIHEGQDDLLTDAVSEIMKFKTDIPDLQLEEGIVLGDLLNDVPQFSENLSVHSFGSNRPSEESSGYVSCVMSSGTPSPTNSPQAKVESPGSNIHDVGQNVEIDHFQAIKTSQSPEFDEFKKTISISEQDDPLPQRTLFRSQVPSSGHVANNRVHFIVRPSQSIPFSSKPKLGIENPLYCNIRRLTPLPGVKHHLEATESKTLNQQNKPGNFVQILKAPGIRRLPVSPGATTSPSSSDSDFREGGDDVTMAPYTQFHVKTTNQMNSDSTGGRSSRFKSSIEMPHHYSHFDRSDSPASRVHSRTRSPMRVDRSDASPSGILILTDEEKRTLLTEGYSIPTRLPLSKQDERNLKKVRRKIKNKISAQESRRKKKEYVEALERKINIYSQENMDLKRRVDGLESTNRSLLGQLRLLQQLINKSKTNSPAGNGFASTGSTAGSHSSTFSHSTESPKLNYRGNNTAVSAAASSNSAVTTSGGGGSASTCLMVFALCFCALLVGKPPPTTSTNQNALDSSRLIFAPQPQGLFDNFISQGPAGLVSGSLSQIGYTWSHNHVYGPSSYGSRLRSRHANWFAGNTSSSGMRLSSTTVRSHLKPTDCCSSIIHAHGHQPISNKVSASAPKSRLLGAPSELEECFAPARTIWSFLFGYPGDTKPAVGAKHGEYKCSQTDLHFVWNEEDHVQNELDLELALVDEQEALLMTSKMIPQPNATTSWSQTHDLEQSLSDHNALKIVMPTTTTTATNFTVDHRTAVITVA